MSGDDVVRWAVRCIKPDGIRRVVFKKYDDRAQAEIDLTGLRLVGIRAEIVELAPDGTELDAFSPSVAR